MNKNIHSLILLDTHIWFWLIRDHPKVNHPHFKKFIEEKAAESTIRVSIISVWEIGMLVQKGRIELPYHALEWVYKALQAPGLSLEPITPEIAISSTNLPGDFHADPADQILIATASNLNATLITEDEHILSYCHKHHLSARSI